MPAKPNLRAMTQADLLRYHVKKLEAKIARQNLQLKDANEKIKTLETEVNALRTFQA